MKVSFIAIPEAMVSTISGPMDVLSSSGLLWNFLAGEEVESHFQVEVLAELDDTVQCYNGFVMNCDACIEEVDATDLIIIPSLALGAEGLVDKHPKLISWIKTMHQQGAKVASVCTGAFILAESGLLNHRQATTHWAFSDLFAEIYPLVELVPERSLVDTGDIATAGAGAAWQDLILKLIEVHYNKKVALQAAKMFLLQNHQTGQKPFNTFFRPNAKDAIILSAEKWIKEHIGEQDLINRCAEHVGLSPRNLKSRFKSVTGLSPLNYIQKERVEIAKEALELTSRPIEEIALNIGYGDTSFFRRVFKRETNMTPNEYRKHFKLSI